MSAFIFNGRDFAKQKEEELQKRVDSLKFSGKTPKLTAIIVGEDEASHLYVKLKRQAAERIGVNFVTIHHKELNKIELIQLIESENSKDNDGLMVQLPLPQELDTKEETFGILSHIDPKKDVDGQTGKGYFIPATVKAILYAIEQSKFKIKFKSGVICVVGATGSVGSGVVRELEKAGGYTIIKCNSKTQDLKSETLKADIIVTVTGIPGIIKKDMVKKGAVVIDVGSPKPEVEEEVKEVASFITPVPGGIGPMTVVCLMENTVDAATS